MRVYTVGFQNISVSAVQDLIALYAGANGAIEIISAWLEQVTQTSNGNLRLSWKRLPATVTAGSAGSAGTVNKTRSGDAAATVTARTNDTTQATTGGTAVVMPDGWNLLNGYFYQPAPDARIACNPSEALVLSLDQAPGSAVVVNGSVTFRELIPA